MEKRLWEGSTIQGRRDDVTVRDHIDYHSKRAMAELDLSLRAGNVAAARAHARLSSLHLDRAKILGETGWDMAAASS